MAPQRRALVVGVLALSGASLASARSLSDNVVLPGSVQANVLRVDFENTQTPLSYSDGDVLTLETFTQGDVCLLAENPDVLQFCSVDDEALMDFSQVRSAPLWGCRAASLPSSSRQLDRRPCGCVAPSPEVTWTLVSRFFNTDRAALCCGLAGWAPPAKGKHSLRCCGPPRHVMAHTARQAFQLNSRLSISSLLRPAVPQCGGGPVPGSRPGARSPRAAECRPAPSHSCSVEMS